MATRKITITLPEDQIREILSLVGARRAANVSAFVKNAVGIALSDETGWNEMLKAVLERTGGPLTQKERDWADSILLPKPPKKTSRKRKAA